MEIYNYAITAALPAALPLRERASVVSVWHPMPAVLAPAPAAVPAPVTAAVPAPVTAAVPAPVTAAVPVPQQGISVFGTEHGRTLSGVIGGVRVNGTTGINGTNGITSITKKRMDLRGVPPRGRPV
ncbi:hypothetical protein ACK8GG_17875 [Micromonosporaceae bacterium DT55]|uniref:hypothetical protein n=1 Tax=Melissospora conviva TaxID=3388432 RepID=UPI003C1DFC51